MILQVQAVDDASPPMTGMAQVIVQVTNINDNPPIITNPAGEKLPYMCNLTSILGVIYSYCVFVDPCRFKCCLQSAGGHCTLNPVFCDSYWCRWRCTNVHTNTIHGELSVLDNKFFDSESNIATLAILGTTHVLTLHAWSIMHVLSIRANYEVNSSLVHRLNQKTMNKAMGIHAKKKSMGFLNLASD